MLPQKSYMYNFFDGLGGHTDEHLYVLHTIGILQFQGRVGTLRVGEEFQVPPPHSTCTFVGSCLATKFL